MALRRTLNSDPNAFPRDVLELQGYFAGDPDARIMAVPGTGAAVDIWILGSSTFGAQLAAALGLPYAFASHFAPGMMDQAIEQYRAHFRPSERLAKPYVMVGFNIFAADSMAEAKLVASSMQQGFVALRTGQPGRVKPPVEGYYESLPPNAQAMLDDVLSVSAIGTADVVAEDLRRIIRRTGADEVMVTSQIFDQTARKRSLAIAAEAFAQVGEAV
jgi:luciferase family oxidoreductase group 1